MAQRIKPKLWKYKTGLNAGKLRPKAKQYLSYKLKEYWKIKKEKEFKEEIKEKIKIFQSKTYFINFNFEENIRGNDGSGLFGSLVSEKEIDIEDGKILIKNALPMGYTPTNFYTAEENEKHKGTQLIIFRDGNEIHEEEIYV